MTQTDEGRVGGLEPDDSYGEESSRQIAAHSDQNYLRIPLPPPKVLLLDDDKKVRESLREDFAKKGIQADCVATTGEARSLLMAGHDYKVIFVDIRLGESDDTGDKFILGNLKMLGSAKVAAITAEFYLNDMDPATLAKLVQVKVEVIPKRKGFSAKLVETVENVIAEEKRQMLTKIENLLRPDSPPTPVPPKPQQPPSLPGEFVMMLEQILLDWLRSRQHPDKKRVLHGGTLYSYNDIADEIEQGSELGKTHLKLMASLFMRTMSIDS